jgi:hypothetical protein
VNGQLRQLSLMVAAILAAGVVSAGEAQLFLCYERINELERANGMQLTPAGKCGEWCIPHPLSVHHRAALPGTTRRRPGRYDY